MLYSNPIVANGISAKYIPMVNVDNITIDTDLNKNITTTINAHIIILGKNIKIPLLLNIANSFANSTSLNKS